jgi:hypothetical protein
VCVFFKVIFVLNELESVEYLRQSNLSTFLSPVTLDNNQQRLFNYELIGRQCNYTWTIFKKIFSTNSTIEHVDTNSNLCIHITYPTSDAATVNDSGLFVLKFVLINEIYLYLGWSTLRTVLFSLLGVVLAAIGGLIAFFVIRFVEL